MSSVQSLFNLNKYGYWVFQLNVVNCQPTNILPSDNGTTLLIRPLNHTHILNEESNVQSAFNLANFSVVYQLYVLNNPQTNNFQSLCSAMAFT